MYQVRVHGYKLEHGLLYLIMERCAASLDVLYADGP